MIAIATLGLALAGASVLGFTAIRRASSAHPDTSGAQAPVASETPVVSEPPVMSEPPVASETPVVSKTPVVSETPVVSKTPVAPAAAPEKMPVSPPSPPTPARPDAAHADGATPRRGPADAAPAQGVTPPTNRTNGLSAPARGDQQSSEIADPTAAIDWLLKSSRAKGQ